MQGVKFVGDGYTHCEGKTLHLNTHLTWLIACKMLHYLWNELYAIMFVVLI